MADRRILAAVLFVLSCLSLPVVPRAGGRIVQSFTELPAVDSVTVGERIRITHSFIYPDSLSMRVPEKIDPGTCRILSVVWRENRSDRKIEKSADISMITLDLEEARLPAIAVDFITPSGDTLVAFSDEVLIPVRQMTAGASDPRPLKEQWIAPVSYTKWIVAGLLLLAAAALLVWWVRRRARRAVEEPPEPVLPADYIALTELSRLERMNMLERGEFKKYYTLVTDVIRRYLEARFNVDAIDRTTSELLGELEDRRCRVEKLDGLLNEADLVKFARFKPAEATGKAAMSTAREIVVKTKPAPVAAAQDTETRAAGGGGNR